MLRYPSFIRAGLGRWPTSVLLAIVLGCLPWAGARAADDGRLELCLDPLNMPYSAQFADPPGFDAEIGRLLGKRMGRPVAVAWADTGTRGGLGRALRTSISAGKCNAFMGMVNDPEVVDELGEKKLVLTRAYMAVSEVVVTRPDGPHITRLEELAKHKTAIQAATLGHKLVITHEYPYSTYRFLKEALQAVIDGEVDDALLFGPMAGWAIQNDYRGKVIISPDFKPGPDLRWDIAIAVREQDAKLKQDLDRAIGELIEANQIQPILAKYGVPYLEPSRP